MSWKSASRRSSRRSPTRSRLTEKLTAPDGDLQKHRQAVNSLASQALETHATIDTLRKERASLEELRTQLRHTTGEVKQSVDGTTALKSELDGVRTVATQLNQDYQRIREASRAAREDAASATENVKEIEKKLGPLIQLQALSKSTEERLASLNALAEHVTHKAKALEAQKHAIDHAAVQANRLNEMVWSMDVQINKLTEGHKQVQRAEETVARMEKLAQDTGAELQVATTAREEFTREFARLEKDSRSLSDYLKTSVERLAVEKKEFDVFDQRLRAVQGAIGESETRTDALLAKDKMLSALTQRADGLNKDFLTLVAQADELSHKQGALETLGERLAQVDELGKRTTAQHASLIQSRQDLDVLRKDIQDFHRSYAEAAQLRDKLGADRAALEAFGERTTLLLTQTPALESRMDAVLNKMDLVEEGTKSATRLGELATELDSQLSRVGARSQFIEKLEGRINNLHAVTTDVDRKLGEQLARRSELDTLKSLCDTVGTQVVDAQQKLDGVSALQHKLVPLAEEMDRLSELVGATSQDVKSVQQDEEAIADQRTRLIGLVEQARTLSVDVGERQKQVQNVSDELARATSVKDELLTELSRVQARQRDALSQTDAAEDQLKRADTMVKQLEQRRSQLSFSEKKIVGFEQRVSDLHQHTTNIEQKIKSIAEREALVLAVKAEVDAVHLVSSRSKADLQYVAEHRNDVTTLRAQVEDLLGRVSERIRRSRRSRAAGRWWKRCNRGRTRLRTARRHQRQPRSPRRAEDDDRPRRREAGAARFHGAGGAEHAAGPAARARSVRAPRAEHQVAAHARGDTGGEDSLGGARSRPQPRAGAHGALKPVAPCCRCVAPSAALNGATAGAPLAGRSWLQGRRPFGRRLFIQVWSWMLKRRRPDQPAAVPAAGASEQPHARVWVRTAR